MVRRLATLVVVAIVGTWPPADVLIEQILSCRPAAIVALWPNRSLDQTTRASEIALWNALPAVA